MPTAEQVRAARKAAGLTQAAAADLCCRTERSWQDAELGKRQLDGAAWEMFLLMTDQHPHYRLVKRRLKPAPVKD